MTEDYIKSLELDDSFGWGKRLQFFCENQRSQSCGVVLTGPSGAGKHQAMFFLVQILGQEDYQTIFLSGEDLQREEESFSQVKDRIETILKDFRGIKDEDDEDFDPDEEPEGTNLCLVIENPGNSDCESDLFTYLGHTLCDVKMNGKSPLFLILLNEEELNLPSMLRRQLHQCKIALPTQRARKKYLERNGDPIKNYVDFEKAAELTQDYSYAMLRDLLLNIGLLIDQCDEDGDEFDQELVESFILQQGNEIEIDYHLEFLKQAETFNEQMKTFLERIPEMMEKMGSSVITLPGNNTNINTSVIENPQTDTVTSATGEEIDFSKIPTNQLMTELWGEERVGNLKKQASERRAVLQN